MTANPMSTYVSAYGSGYKKEHKPFFDILKNTKAGIGKPVYKFEYQLIEAEIDFQKSRTRKQD